MGFLDIWKHLEYSVSKKYYYTKRSNIKMEESKLIDGLMQFGLTRQKHLSIYVWQVTGNYQGMKYPRLQESPGRMYTVP